jgi:hypothetical protein
MAEKQKAEQPKVLLAQDEDGKLKAVTGVDEKSGNVFNNLFNQGHNLFEYKDDVKSTTELSNQENHKNQVNQGSDGGSLLGLLDVNPSGSNDHEEENFVREQKRQRKKIQKKRGRRM